MARPNREVTVSEACFPNIGRKGRTRRFVSGAVWATVTVAVWGMLALRQAPTAAFLAVAPFVTIAALYFFQAKEKT